MTELLIFLFLSNIVLLSLILERKLSWARSFGAALICIVLGIVFSNLGVIPHQSPVYDGIFTYLVPIAVFFLLLHVDIRELKKAGPSMFIAFFLGAVGVILGVFVGVLIFKGWMGAEYWKIAGMFTGTYVGGGVNYVAVANALDVSPSIMAGGAAADNLTTAIWMIVCILPQN